MSNVLEEKLKELETWIKTQSNLPQNLCMCEKQKLFL